MYFDASSAIRLHSPLSSSHDVIKCHAFYHNVHHHGHWTAAAYGSLKPPPTGRFRGVHPHLSHSMTLFRVFLTQLLQPHYRTFFARTSRSAPVLRIGTLASRFWPLALLPSHRSDWFLQFRAIACIRVTPPLRRPPPAQSSGSSRVYPRRDTRLWFRRHLIS